MAEVTYPISWDESGKRLYETGVQKGVFYPAVESEGTVAYKPGVPWNGLTAVTETPSGAESTPLYADDIKYLNLMSAEEFAASIEAYSYPPEFAECDGSASLVEGATIGQQDRKIFGLCYRTTLGNDILGNAYGYKLHLVYGLMASPSEKGFTTINDSPDAVTFSWEAKSTPVNVSGFKATSIITVDSTKVNETGLKALEAALYGTSENEAYLPLPDEVKTLLSAAA